MGELPDSNSAATVKLALELASVGSNFGFDSSDLHLGLGDHLSLGSGPTLAQLDEKAKKSQNMTECVPVPSSEHVAEIVGRQGCKIKALRAKTNTYIKTPVRGEEPVFVVTGGKEDVTLAKRKSFRLPNTSHKSELLEKTISTLPWRSGSLWPTRPVSRPSRCGFLTA